MAQSDMLPCAKTFQRLSGAVHEQGWAETAAELREVFAGWVKRIDAMAADDASTEFSEDTGDVDSE